MGTAALQDLPIAEAAIVHNFGGFTGATNNYNPGAGGASNIPISTNASIKVFNNVGNSIYGNEGTNTLSMVRSGGYFKRLTTADVVNGSGSLLFAFFADGGCTTDGGQNWLTMPDGYIGFTMADGKNGWMRVSFNCGGGGSTVIHEFAYEDVAGQPIQVGDTGVNAPDVLTLSEWGLLNLVILLIIFGTIYLIKPNFSLRK